MKLDIAPNPQLAYSLLHEGTHAMADMEAEGARIDTDYLEAAKPKLLAQIKEVEARIHEMDEWKKWRKHFGPKANLDSNEELAFVLWDLLGYECPAWTDSGQQKTDASALATVGTPFVEAVLERAKLEKARGTYLEAFNKHMTPEGFLHTNFNLHTTVTYRSSSDAPNFQNMPARDEKIMKIVRSAFIPRPGNVIIECDYSAVEVRVAACYHEDPVMMQYICDPTKDMHRDMAGQIYFLDVPWLKSSGKMGKLIRNIAKNKYVFPEFYGSCWFQVAVDLWKDIEKYKLQGPDGKSLYEHLKAHGIKELGERPGRDSAEKKPKKGTFMRHVMEVEDDFWNNRFKVYGEWKKRWWKQFEEKGYFNTLTGFTITGNLARNDVINYPVQGAAFHCLLWSVTRLNKLMRKRGMKARLIGQIHDSCIADVPIEEIDDYMKLAQQVMCIDIRKKFKWLNVPLASEADITPPNGSWGDKRAVEFTSDNTYVVETKEGKQTFARGVDLAEFLREQHTKDTGAPLRRKKLKTRII